MTVYKFKLNSNFLSDMGQEDIPWGPVGYITYKRTYARPGEEWIDTCQRVVEGVYNVQKNHCAKLSLPWDNIKAQRSAQEMFRRMYHFKWLPPGRGLWMMGTDYIEERGGAPLNNCGFVSTENIDQDFAEPFRWLMDMSMLGVGVGFDTKGAGKLTIQEPKVSEETHVVEDSREGWCNALRQMLNPFAGRGALPRFWDFSLVRAEGTAISGFGGTSSGPQPLKDLLDEVWLLLDSKVGLPLDSTTIVDIANLIGKCVVSGNVRRSAEIAFGEPDDIEFLDLKNPDKPEMQSHRWASNNSIFATVGMDYSQVAELTARNGEPGYEWLENAQGYSRMGREKDHKDHRAKGGNPCLEQTLEDRELCCLVETFPGRHEDYEDYQRTLKYAYLYAKSVTLIPTHDERTNQVLLRNRRIGTSQSGIIQAMKRHGRREFFQWCDRGYEYLRSLDAIYSDWLCSRESIKITSTKPSGTVSLLPGVSPGIHHPHSEFYLRRIRFNVNSPLLEPLRKAGYRMEEDFYSPNTIVVEFPVQEEFYDRGKEDVTMWEQLELASQVQTYWSDNQVSITVTFKPHEAKDIKYALELYETRLKGVSFLPLTDHGYAQAPYETITAEKYHGYVSMLKPIDFDSDSHEVTELFCDSDVCEVA